jgi:hypothetical protein
MKASDKLAMQKDRILKRLNDIDLRVQMKDVPEIIKKRTRKGYGITKKNDGEWTQLKELAESTIEARKSKKLHKDTKPSKSNLTETGQLLDGIKQEASNKKMVKLVTGREDIRATIEKKRKFFGLTKEEKNTVDQKVKKEIARIIKEES